jgi:NADP-reducing hydrogenase subunit HndD
MEIINLKIDNKPVVVKKGTTVLKAAESIGIDIPTLCHMKLDDLNIENKPGGCRVCVVEVKDAATWPRPAAPKLPKAWR